MTSSRARELVSLATAHDPDVMQTSDEKTNVVAPSSANTPHHQSTPSHFDEERIGPHHPLRKHMNFTPMGKSCISCNTQWSAKTSTDAVWKHFMSHHDNIWTKEAELGNIPIHLLQLHPVVLTKALPYESDSSAQQNRKAALIQFWVKKNLPLSLLDDEETQTFLHAFDARFIVPTSSTVTKELEGLRLQKISEMKGVLRDSANTIWLTADGWTSRNDLRYFTVTAHVLKADYSRSNYVLGLFCFPGSHTHEHIVAELEMILHTYDLTFKNIAGLTTDGEPSMKSAQELLGQRYPHLKRMICVIHTVQLVAEHAKKACSSLKNTVEAVQKTFAHYHNSPSMMEELLTMQAKHQPEGHSHVLRPLLPFDSCWDNDFTLLSRAHDLAPFLLRVMHADQSKATQERFKHSNELALPADLLTLLNPLQIAFGLLEDITKEFSKETHALGDVPTFLSHLVLKMTARYVYLISTGLHFV